MSNNKKLIELKKLLKWALDSKLLKIKMKYSWLTIRYKENLDATGKNIKWPILCSQNLNDFSIGTIQQRVVLMLAEELRSVKQDCNILLEDGRTNI